MFSKTVFCVIFIFLVTGCATREDAVSIEEPRNLITRDDYEDLQVKPPQKKPIEVDYSQGIMKQNFSLVPSKTEQELIQDRFLSQATYGSVDELRLRYENGAKVNFRNQDGETALISVLEGPYDNQTLLKFGFLLSVGAKVNFYGKSKSNQNTAPLNVAVLNSSRVFQSDTASQNPFIAEYILKYLIEKGADITSNDEYGRTPLHIAAMTNNLVAAKILLEADAPAMQQDNFGRTPLHLAKSHQMEAILKEYGAVETEDPFPDFDTKKDEIQQANKPGETWQPLRDAKPF